MGNFARSENLSGCVYRSQEEENTCREEAGSRPNVKGTGERDELSVTGRRKVGRTKPMAQMKHLGKEHQAMLRTNAQSTVH